jgi:hypothetical protein
MQPSARVNKPVQQELALVCMHELCLLLFYTFEFCLLELRRSLIFLVLLACIFLHDLRYIILLDIILCSVF